MIIEKELQARLDSLVGFNLKLDDQIYTKGVLVKAKVFNPWVEVKLLQPSGEVETFSFYFVSLNQMRDFRIEVIED